MRTRAPVNVGPFGISGGGCYWLPAVLLLAVVAGVVLAVVGSTH